MSSEPNALTPTEAALERTVRGWCAELDTGRKFWWVTGTASSTTCSSPCAPEKLAGAGASVDHPLPAALGEATVVVMLGKDVASKKVMLSAG